MRQANGRPRPIPAPCAEQITSAYRLMAEYARYRPAAPSDGFGGITVPLEELDIDAEAWDYTERWWTDEDDCEFFIGHANFNYRRAMIFAVEAARLMCGDNDVLPYVRALLTLALAELNHMERQEAS